MKRLLIAGIGNIFMGDDAFGVEAVQLLARRPLPEEVRVVDFGIRSYDLACALTDGYEAAVLVDAVPRGGMPGTLYLIEPDAESATPSGALPDGHSLDPVQVLGLAKALGGPLPALYLVGCEPAGPAPEESAMGLSDPVRAALPGAVELIESIIGKCLGRGGRAKAGTMPVEQDISI